MRSDRQQIAWLLRRCVAPYWKAMVVLVASSFAATAMAALLPVLMAPILDLALGAPAPAAAGDGLSLKNLGAAVLGWTQRWLGGAWTDNRLAAVAALCGVYVAVGFAKAGLDFWNYMLALWIRVRAAAGLQSELFRHLLGLSMSFFARQRTGEVVSRLVTDTSATSQGLETAVTAALSAPVLILFYGFLLFRTSPRLVVAAAGAAVLHWAVTRGVRGPIRRLATDQFSVLAELAARFQEAVLSIRVIKSFGAEATEHAGLKRALARVLRINVRYGAYKHAEEPVRAALNYLVEAALLLLAVWELLAGRLSVATFFLFLYVGRALVAQIGQLAGAYTQLQGSLAAATRLGEVLAAEPDVADGPGTITEFRDRIALRDVSFHYGGEPVLEGVSLEIRRGEMVALVGPSGAGKSTLADLVLRLYDPRQGTISIDGRDLRTLRQADYRRLFGVVSQEALLFNTTIRDNITYGREGLTDADVARAARIANADGFIAELSQGYDTVVGDRGVRLSGGQRQRVAIARAIVARPPLLVLDEATSALDTESERLVQEAIDRVIQGTTTLVIAHRLSTVLHADRIVVLNRRGVEAVGTHAELLASSETYARLYRLQFAEAPALASETDTP